MRQQDVRDWMDSNPGPHTAREIAIGVTGRDDYAAIHAARNAILKLVRHSIISVDGAVVSEQGTPVRIYSLMEARL